MSLHLAILRNQYRDSVALMQLSAALARAKASFLVASFTTDWRFSPARSDRKSVV